MSFERQNLNFNLIRSGQLNSREIALLCYINTFSTECRPRTAETIAIALNCCEKTVRRTIDALVLKGLIIKRYTVFKRMVLRLVSLAEQAKLLGMGMIKSVVDKSLKLKKKVYDRTPMSELNRTPMSESIKSKDLENKTINTFNLNFSSLGKMPEIPGGGSAWSQVQRYLAQSK